MRRILRRLRSIDKEDFYMYLLCNTQGLGRMSIKKLIGLFGNAYNVCTGDIHIIEKTGILGSKQLCALKQALEYKNKKILYEKMITDSCSWVSRSNSLYPEKLKNIYDAPHGIYYRGKLPCNEGLSVAIVGSRRCSSYGRRMAYNLAQSFADMGIQVVSGMAAGIDAAAHAGCIDAGGYTCAVLGCGADICYPRENSDLYGRIIKTGGIISEYPCKTRPDAWRFPERNRIISGLSDIVIVVEAELKSGAMITVDQALEQNREVMAVPGRADDVCSKGCNELIKSGAMVITQPEDIWQCGSALLWKEKNNNKTDKNNEISKNNKINKNYEINKHENPDISASNDGNGQKSTSDMTVNLLASEKKLVYSVLCLHPKDTDEIIKETGLDISTVIQTLLILQLEGCVEEVAKNCFIRIK